MDNFCVYRKIMLDVVGGNAYVLCMDFGGMDMNRFTDELRSFGASITYEAADVIDNMDNHIDSLIHENALLKMKLAGAESLIRGDDSVPPRVEPNAYVANEALK